jgi:hypothetical protein
MEQPSDPLDEAPTGPPMDADEEKRRLTKDAAARGIDPEAAIALAEEASHLMPLAAAYRAVDRRVAAGFSLKETEDIVRAQPPPPTDQEV